MPRAVRYDEFGDIDVLRVDQVERPQPGPGEVLVAVRAAGINPGEATIRKGVMADRWPSTFPSGQGSDLAGVIEEVGDGVNGWAAGDEVIGWVDNRSSQAELVAVPADQLLRKPAGVSWEQAGALHVAGATAWAAVQAVDPRSGEVLVVSGAAGGVGSLVVQLGVERGARVLGLAGPDNHSWLRSHGVEPIAYGDGVEERIRAAAPSGVDAFIDTYGGGYVDLAIALGVAPERIDTIIDWAAAAKYGAKTDGNAVGANVADLSEMAARLGDGRLEIPIAGTYPLEQVQDAYRELEKRHTRGKIVLVP
jgi:NADPH:quinone reductase-like Zn-dependent oxidoreductase